MKTGQSGAAAGARLLTILGVSICLATLGRVLAQDTITITSPTASTLWYVGQTYTITWTKTGTGVPNVIIEVCRNFGSVPENWETITSSTPTSSSIETIIYA